MLNKLVGQLTSGLLMAAVLLAAWGLVGLAWRWANSVWFGM